MNHMFNVIYTYESVLPESEGELRHMNLGQFDSEDAARDYILDEFDAAIAKMDDDDEAEIQTKYLSEYFTKSYSVEAAV
jgi:hypothetical protein